MRILNFNSAPNYLEQIASWWHEQWGHINPQRTFEDRLKELENFLNSPNDLPQLWIALEHDTLLGTASLVANDLPSVEHGHSPWLASVYVSPELRKNGIGAALVHHVINETKKIYPNLTLFTEDQAPWYEKMGFKQIENRQHSGYDITIMQMNFRDPS